MPTVQQIPVSNQKAGIIWPARSDPAVTSLLIRNQDINNTIYVGNTSNIMPASINVIPVEPNGAIILDAGSPWYVVGAAAGILPLVMIPNSQGYFRGITQGLGKLSIPSVQSPNYVTGVSGWTINKDGSAEFNNLTERGNFVGPDFYLSNGDGTYTSEAGLFIYSSTPAAGNLIFSDCKQSGNDKFSNNFLGSMTTYDNSTLGAVNILGIAITWYSMTANPNATFTAGPKFSGTTGPNVLDFDTGSGFVNTLDVDASGMLETTPGNDLVTYKVAGTLDKYSTSGQDITLASFTAVQTFSNLIAGATYRVTCILDLLANAGGGNAVIGWTHSTTATLTGLMSRAWFTGGAGPTAEQITHGTTFPADATSAALVNGASITY